MPKRSSTHTSARRMFVGVLPAAKAVAELQDRLEPLLVRWPYLRWTEPSGWHLTTCFMTRVPDENYPRLVDELIELARRTAVFVLGLSGAGAFGAAGAPKQLWLGVDDPMEALTQLAAGSRRAARRAGIAPTDGDFQPHLTLARSKSVDFGPQLAILGDWMIETWAVTEFVLMESFLGQGPGGRPRYVIDRRFELAKH